MMTAWEILTLAQNKSATYLRRWAPALRKTRLYKWWVNL